MLHLEFPGYSRSGLSQNFEKPNQGKSKLYVDIENGACSPAYKKTAFSTASSI
jgi:hypothetical protein